MVGKVWYRSDDTKSGHIAVDSNGTLMVRDRGIVPGRPDGFFAT